MWELTFGGLGGRFCVLVPTLLSDPQDLRLCGLLYNCYINVLRNFLHVQNWADVNDVVHPSIPKQAPNNGVTKIDMPGFAGIYSVNHDMVLSIQVQAVILQNLNRNLFSVLAENTFFPWILRCICPFHGRAAPLADLNELENTRQLRPIPSFSTTRRDPASSPASIQATFITPWLELLALAF